jgi:hypothetical protein
MGRETQATRRPPADCAIIADYPRGAVPGSRELGDDRILLLER